MKIHVDAASPTRVSVKKRGEDAASAKKDGYV